MTVSPFHCDSKWKRSTFKWWLLRTRLISWDPEVLISMIVLLSWIKFRTIECFEQTLLLLKLKSFNLEMSKYKSGWMEFEEATYLSDLFQQIVSECRVSVELENIWSFWFTKYLTGESSTKTLQRPLMKCCDLWCCWSVYFEWLVKDFYFLDSASSVWGAGWSQLSSPVTVDIFSWSVWIIPGDDGEDLLSRGGE